MNEIKRNAIVFPSVNGPVTPNGRDEPSKRTGADFSAFLDRARVLMSVPARLPISKEGVPLAQNGPMQMPVRGAARPDAEKNFNERALGLRAYRQELLASNIANADTPGYKAVDIDIVDALRSGLWATSKLQLKYHVPTQGSVDGNTVDMDVERAKFAENALMYEYHVDRVKGYYKNMDDLLRNTPY